MTSRIKGLTSQEVEKSLKLHGDNSLKKEKGKGFFKRFIENLSDPIIRILMIALLLQIIFTFGNIDYFELGGIIVAIFLSTIVSTVSEYRSEKAFEKLNEDGIDGQVTVLRDGEIKRISSSNIVVGDIVYLSVGEKIQADAEILSGKISVDQSALNGESIECIKYCSKSRTWDLSEVGRVFRGTIVTDGNAIVRVLRVGGETYYGMIAKDVQTETRLSPLKLRLGRLAEQISKIGYVVAIVVGLTYIFNCIVLDNNYDIEKIKLFICDFKTITGCIIRAVTLMITVTVVAAPEGLPMMITVVLSANMKKMLSDNILVKKLVGIETAGSMNILFTDKTGTITVGKPECERFITVSGTCKGMGALRKMSKIHQLLSISARYNSDVIMVGNEITGGNATDRAIWKFFASEDTPKCQIEYKDSFSSEKKYSSVKLKNGIILTKGAAEMILVSSKKAINGNGEVVKFDSDTIYNEYISAVEAGQRVIGVSLGDRENGESIFVALIVMKDKIRQDV